MAASAAIAAFSSCAGIGDQQTNAMMNRSGVGFIGIWDSQEDFNETSKTKGADLTAPRQQAPTSASKKDATSRADLARQLCLSWGHLKFVGFVDGPEAFESRKSSDV